MDEGERITLRLEAEHLLAIDAFLKANPSVPSRSALARDAIRVYVEQVTLGGNTVTIRVPRRYLDYIDFLIADGLFLDRGHAIVRCVEDWFGKDRVKEIQEHRTAIDKQTGRIVEVSTGDKDEVISR